MMKSVMNIWLTKKENLSTQNVASFYYFLKNCGPCIYFVQKLYGGRYGIRPVDQFKGINLDKNSPYAGMAFYQAVLTK